MSVKIAPLFPASAKIKKEKKRGGEGKEKRNSSGNYRRCCFLILSCLRRGLEKIIKKLRNCGVLVNFACLI